MKIVTSSFANVIHTPFAFGKADNPMIVCAAGEHSRNMDIWLITKDAPPQMLIDSERCLCGPWIVEEGDGIALYCSSQCTDYDDSYRISKYVADSVDGPYTLVAANFLNTEHDAHSPCIVDDWMYFIWKQSKLVRVPLQGGEIQELAGAQIVSELYKPNIYRTGPDQLCMFLTEVPDGVSYRVGVYVGSDGLAWEKVGILTPGTGAYSYKPALYKGNLIRVGRDSERFDPAEAVWFEIEHIKLSELSPVFTDFPYDYYFPEFIV